MKRLALIAVIACNSPLSAELKSGPPLPQKAVVNWGQLPKGWALGQTSGVAVDRSDNVWVFNRGPHPVIEFDKSGNFLQSWGDGMFKSSHGIRVDPDGNVWCVDVAGHSIVKHTSEGRVLMVLGGLNTAGTNETKNAFNRPTGLAFMPGGDFYLSDGYVNSRVVKFHRDGEYWMQWGHKGTGDGEFDTVHDVTLDSKGRVYVADRENSRVQIFTPDGKFIGKWTDVGQPWGLYYVAKEDAIYMSDGLNNRIVKLNLDGQILGVLGSYGRAPGQLDFPHNLAVDSEGSIYVAEITNWRVQKFAK
jgi:DNA-binding beta-propeller fold protein YncE